MKKSLYPKLAFTGMRKNRKFYLPYILTCIGMIMMYNILSALIYDSSVPKLFGGSTLVIVLKLGSWVIAIFSVIFLFYTNSFLMRRRRKEFGLYNILGMGKRNIAFVILWENLIIAAISLLCGIAGGTLLSKLAESGLAYMLKGTSEYDMLFSQTAAVMSAAVFGVIFLLIFLNSLRQVKWSSPIELIKSENAGEKPPKGNWFFGLLGVLVLGAAYYIAVSIEDPVSALGWFFIAVIMVIAATYAIFISASVLLCRILKRRKNYYYKTKHFVSVSSMAYRMKRNGAGLASICILCTMVLVMMTGSACLYFGEEDALHLRYPQDIIVNITTNDEDGVSDTRISEIRNNIDSVLSDHSIEPSYSVDYRSASISGHIKNGMFTNNAETSEGLGLDTLGDMCAVYFVPLADYNALSGSNETLRENEGLIYPFRCAYNEKYFTVDGGNTYSVARTLDSFPISGDIAMNLMPSIIAIVPDMHESVLPLMNRDYGDQAHFTVTFMWYHGFDTDAGIEVQQELPGEIYHYLKETVDTDGYFQINCDGIEVSRYDYYSLFGGTFFLGILLSIVFIFAGVLIIYYKQVSEGYEDQSRFEIMQKVGMTAKEIRKSINSQMLTVFLLPLAAAVLHLAFAFPLIYKLLMLFNLNNLQLLIAVTGICAFVFMLLYMIVYKITSNAYYAIVKK